MDDVRQITALLVAGMACATLIGCETTYGPMPSSSLGREFKNYGYRESKLSVNEWLLSYTDDDQFKAAAGFARRAAELCPHGYSASGSPGSPPPPSATPSGEPVPVANVLSVSTTPAGMTEQTGYIVCK